MWSHCFIVQSKGNIWKHVPQNATYNSKYIMSASATPIVSLKIFGSGFHFPFTRYSTRRTVNYLSESETSLCVLRINNANRKYYFCTDCRYQYLEKTLSKKQSRFTLSGRQTWQLTATSDQLPSFNQVAATYNSFSKRASIR